MSWVTQFSLLLFWRIFHKKYLSLYLLITRNWSCLRIQQWNQSWIIDYYLFTYFTVITKLQKSLFWACPRTSDYCDAMKQAVRKLYWPPFYYLSEVFWGILHVVWKLLMLERYHLTLMDHPKYNNVRDEAVGWPKNFQVSSMTVFSSVSKNITWEACRWRGGSNKCVHAILL